MPELSDTQYDYLRGTYLLSREQVDSMELGALEKFLTGFSSEAVPDNHFSQTKRE